MAKDAIRRLLRIAWVTVGTIIDRVVAERLDDRRLSGLQRVGVDEVSHRRRHRYLTVVADHDTGRIVCLADGRNSQTLADFFAELGERKDSIRAVSIDLSGAYAKAIREQLPDARIANDPLHVVRVAADAVESGPPRRLERPRPLPHADRTLGQAHPLGAAAGARAPEPGLARHVGEVYLHNRRLYRTFLLYHELRLLYQLEDPSLAPAHLDGWLHWASRSRLKPIVRTAWTLRRHRDGILAAIELGSPPAAGRPQQPRPAHQSPLLRLPQQRAPHRADLSLLRRHRHRPAAAMTATQS